VPSSERERIESILREESLCHVGILDEGEVYVIPLNHAYLPGRLVIHCALEGRKLDAIRRNPRVCVEVSRQDCEPSPHAGDRCDAAFSSVICWGAARVVDDPEERLTLLNEFQARYCSPRRTRGALTLEQAASCGAIEITITQATGRVHGATEDLTLRWDPA
jgi:uncharacterized protein